MRQLATSMFVAFVLLCRTSHACAPSASSEVRLALRTQAVVSGGTVMLRDVAYIAGPDADLMRRLCALPLGAAPRVGETLRLNRRSIESWLTRWLQANDLSVQWSGAMEVSLKRADQLVDPDRVLASAREALQDWLSARGGRVEQPTQTPEPVRVPAGRLSLQARRLPTDLKVTRYVRMWVDLMVDERFVRSVPVVFSASVYRDGWVATHDLRAEEILSAASFRRQQIDVAGERDEPLADLPTSGRLRRPVRSGRALTAADVQEVAPITRGAAVRLRSQLGDISLEVRAHAMQDGWPGQPVLIRIDQARGAVRGRVVDTGVVELLH
jgi:flagellar basal body P-ring formation protein FlgA